MVFPPTIHVFIFCIAQLLSHIRIFISIVKKRHALSFAPNLDSAAAAVAGVAEISGSYNHHHASPIGLLLSSTFFFFSITSWPRGY